MVNYGESHPDQRHEPQLAGALSRSTVVRRRFHWAAAIIAGLVVLATVWRVHRIYNDPDLCFLADRSGAQWIRPDLEFVHGIFIRQDEYDGYFEYWFHTSEPIADAQLTVYAFRRCSVVVDSLLLSPPSRTSESWRDPLVYQIPGTLAPGSHRLFIRVSNSGGRACLLAFSEQLGLRTDRTWFSSGDGVNFRPSLAATDRKFSTWAQSFPPVLAEFKRLSPWLAGIFGLTFVVVLAIGRRTAPTVFGRRLDLSPPRLRVCLLIAWVVMGANNICRLPEGYGYDVDSHLDYVQFIVEHRRLPLPLEGWQAFQSPLFYLLAAPWYAWLSPHYDAAQLTRILRVIPLLCGLLQIEVVYRTARLVFPADLDLQRLAIVFGGLMPMHIYISQVICNEPLCGCLTAMVVLLCLHIVVNPAQQRGAGFFLLLGTLWGLAILAKVTPAMLAPLIAAAMTIPLLQGRTSPLRWVGSGALVAAMAGLVCGWYFVRTMIYIGKPFMGGWETGPERGWWQDPSYRTWDQLLTFGVALKQPIYTGTWSVWDSLYSTMWLDGHQLGIMATPSKSAWNVGWMACGAWLALIPMCGILASVVALVNPRLRMARGALLFAMAVVGVYVAAIFDLYVRLPIFSTAKSTYMLGTVPCLAVLASAGLAPLLRNRWLRALLWSGVACWAVAAYVAYFCHDV